MWEGVVPARAGGASLSGWLGGRSAVWSGWLGLRPPCGAAPLLVLFAAERDNPRPGADTGVGARVGAALVGGGDPQKQPEVVAGGRRGLERLAPGTGGEGRPPGMAPGLRTGGWSLDSLNIQCAPLLLVLTHPFSPSKTPLWRSLGTRAGADRSR